jgi:DNA-binding NarL/FixJ family response regulator
MEEKIRVLIVGVLTETWDLFAPGVRVEGDIAIIDRADTGRAGLEKVRRLLPDIVLLDSNLPDMDGLQATALINRELDDVAVIVLVQNDRAALRRAVLAGARGLLVQGSTRSTMLDSIRGCYRQEVARRRGRQQLRDAGLE